MLQEIWQKFMVYVIAPIVITACIYGYQKLNKYLETKRRHFKFAKATIRDQYIKEALIELRVLLNADRAYVIMFHNGSEYVDGSHDMKKSRTHEVVGPGVSYENQNYQDIRISLIPDEIDLLKDEEQPVYAKASDFKDSKFRRMLDSQGVKAVGRCPMKGGQKNPIGFVGVDFGQDDEIPPNFEIICHYAGRIEEIMSRYRNDG